MKKRILVLDGDPSVRRMICRVLSEEDYTAIPAADGDEAVGLAGSAGVDLALLDLSLPGKNPVELFEKFKKSSPSLPCVIISARSTPGASSLANRASAILEKPLDLFRLLRTISRLLGQTVNPEEQLA